MSFWLFRIKNKQYILGLVIALSLASAHIILDICPVISKLDGRTLDYLPATMWIGSTLVGNAHYLFYYLLPLFAVLGLNLICYQDRTKAFVKRYVQYNGIKNYCISIFSISFLSGFLIISIPLLVDLIVVLCLFPNIRPDNLINIGLGVQHRSMYFSNLFFSNPYVTILMYIFGTGCLSGLYACISATLSLYTKTLYAALAAVFLGVIGISFCSMLLSHGALASLLTLPVIVGMNPAVPPLILLILLWGTALLICFCLFIQGVKENVTI